MPRGRRISRTKEQRVEDLQKAINRTGFSGLEVVQMLVDWYSSWQAVEIRFKSSTTFTITPTEKNGGTE